MTSTDDLQAELIASLQGMVDAYLDCYGDEGEDAPESVKRARAALAKAGAKDAPLIVAAPAMHGALIEAAQAAQEAFAEALRYVPEGSCVPPWITRLEQAAERAHAALVMADERFKATGEPT